MLELIAEEMEITLTVEQFEEIVSLFPEVRISLAMHGCSDSEVKGLILDAVFGFFTGCNYPQFKHRIDLGLLVLKIFCY